ncbi:hydrogenase maturation nickel metallochaperone HypA/HybF [Halorussus halobius]|uniref:hydrogenase maturation nickel metallochaperone HypA/HybF n=1 Tax=Halorussus halobius TaxID=1710537 RepID=UPI00109241EF|nr:hydrogenase maturation nickel metallochaperone HypA [Halorussus halobius]
MHELSVAGALLDSAVEAATDHDADEIEALAVELGEATHVNPDQLRFCLETVAEATPAAGATVEIETVPARAACDCGWTGEPPGFEGTAAVVPAARCPECGSGVEFTRGEECRLTSIEIPDSDPRASESGDAKPESNP